MFGDVAATDVAVAARDIITGTTPPHLHGDAAVVVTIPTE